MDPQSVAELSRSSGCAIGTATRGGFHEASCPTFESKVRLLDELATHDAFADPMVRRVAMEIAREARTREPEDLSPAIHAYVRDHVPYLGEGMETFQSTADTLTYGGDCDDSVRAIVALARALAIPARIDAREGDGNRQGHCVALLWDGHAFQYAEASIPAKFGEEPQQALQRLRRAGLVRARSRTDLGSLAGFASLGGFITDELGAASDAVSLAQNPDALYAAALDALHLDPAITATFSPVTKALFETGYQIVSEAVGDEATGIGDAILSEAAEILPQEVINAINAADGIVNSVSSVVAEEVPGISAVLGVIAMGLNAQAQEQAARAAEQDAAAQVLLQRPVVGSGAGGTITPADIFAPNQDAIPDQDGNLRGANTYYAYQPNSALGLILAAITEDQDFEGDGDSNVHHNSRYIDPPGLLWGLFPLRFIGTQPNVGIPADRRRAYQLLRRAMGSHNDDNGASLLPAYLDMLDEDFATGRLTSEWILWLLTHEFNAIPGPDGDPPANIYSTAAADDNGMIYSGPRWSVEEVLPFVTEIEQIVINWRVKRAALKTITLPHLQVSTRIGATLTSAPQTSQSFREVLLNAWPTVPGLPDPTLAALQVVGAICRFETGYGQAWKGTPGEGSNNMGATQAGKSFRGVCPPNSFPHTDTHADGTTYTGCFGIYDSPEKGAAKVLELLVKMGVAPLLSSGDATAVATQMRAKGYFEAPVSKYAKAIFDNASAIAAAFKEPLKVTLSASKGASAAAAVALVLLGAGGVGTAIWWQRRKAKRA